jgi:hypothetical protein
MRKNSTMNECNSKQLRRITGSKPTQKTAPDKKHGKLWFVLSAVVVLVLSYVAFGFLAK